MSALKMCPQCGTEYELDQRFCPKDGSTLRSQQAGGDLVGQIVADRYHVLKKLGEGGMGAVYLAEHVKMGRKSAVKVMNPGMASDPDAISRFNREAANASRINHPNVCAVYDFGETPDGTIYLAMEYIEGQSLSRLIEVQGALLPLRAAEITRQASEALAVAHDMGIVHRDLKPDNIMIARSRDGADVVKVVDFGIAKAANVDNQKVTRTGMVVGTPEYMSPEQLAGDKLDGRSDLYSLALVAFNMLTGKLPFPADTVQESMILRLTDRPRPLAEMKSDVQWPPALQEVFDRALAREAGERYQNASEFGRALFQTVQSMPQSEVSSAFTAVIAAGGGSGAGSAAAGAGMAHTAPIPATRVSTPTPMKASPAVAAKKRGRAPLLAGSLAAVIAIGAAVTWIAINGRSDAGAAAPQGEQIVPPAAVVPDAAPALNLGRELESIRPLVDSAEAVGQALDRLARLDGAARAADDSTLLYFRYLRARALMVSAPDNPKAGCDSLLSIEGRILESAALARAGSTLIEMCRP